MEYLLRNESILSIVVNLFDNSVDYQIDDSEIQSISIPETATTKKNVLFNEINDLAINFFTDSTGKKSIYITQCNKTLKPINEMSKDISIFFTGIFLYAIVSILFYVFLLCYLQINNILSSDDLLFFIPNTINVILILLACYCKHKKVSVLRTIIVFNLFLLSSIFLLIDLIIHQNNSLTHLGLIILNVACTIYSYRLINQVKQYQRYLNLRKTSYVVSQATPTPPID